MDYEQDFEKYNHAESVSRQIDRVNENISRGMQEMEEANFQLYIHQVMMGILALDSMLDPFKQNFSSDYEEVLPDSQEFERKSKLGKLKYAQKCLTQIYNLLDENDLYYAVKAGRKKI